MTLFSIRPNRRSVRDKRAWQAEPARCSPTAQRRVVEAKSFDRVKQKFLVVENLFSTGFSTKSSRIPKAEPLAHAAAGETSLKLDTVSALRFGAELQFQHTEITRVSTLALLKKHMK